MLLDREAVKVPSASKIERMPGMSGSESLSESASKAHQHNPDPDPDKYTKLELHFHASLGAPQENDEPSDLPLAGYARQFDKRCMGCQHKNQGSEAFPAVGAGQDRGGPPLTIPVEIQYVF